MYNKVLAKLIPVYKKTQDNTQSRHFNAYKMTYQPRFHRKNYGITGDIHNLKI